MEQALRVSNSKLYLGSMLSSLSGLTSEDATVFGVGGSMAMVRGRRSSNRQRRSLKPRISCKIFEDKDLWIHNIKVQREQLAKKQSMGVPYMKHYNSFKWTDFKHLTYRFHGKNGNVKYFTV